MHSSRMPTAVFPATHAPPPHQACLPVKHAPCHACPPAMHAPATHAPLPCTPPCHTCHACPHHARSLAMHGPPWTEFLTHNNPADKGARSLMRKRRILTKTRNEEHGINCSRYILSPPKLIQFIRYLLFTVIFLGEMYWLFMYPPKINLNKNAFQ